jgi:hypothetical protein
MQQQRSKIAQVAMKELNELVNSRKQLQLQAFRMTEMYKQHVDQMTVNKVRDIFQPNQVQKKDPNRSLLGSSRDQR